MREKAKRKHVHAGLLKISPSRPTLKKTACSRTEEEMMKKVNNKICAIVLWKKDKKLHHQ